MNFRPIEISDKPLFERYQKGCGLCGTLSGFASCYFWCEPYGNGMEVVGKTLFIGRETDACVTVFSPFSDDFDSDLKKVAEYAKAAKKRFEIRTLERGNYDRIASLFPDASVQTERDYADYIYRTADLAALSGKPYHAKKNHWNQFQKRYSYEFLPLTEEKMQTVLTLDSAWLSEREERDTALSVETAAIQIVAAHFEELAPIGGVLYVDGKPAAFTIATRLRPDADIYDVHFEKALSFVEGGYVAVNRLFAEREAQNVTYLNREDDMGLPGLRKAKLSYHPCEILEKRVLILEA